MKLTKYKYWWLALYVPVYLVSFFLLERHVTAGYYVSYLPIDDMIPFCEEFIVFYCLWYPFLIATGLWLLTHDSAAFARYMAFIIAGFSLSLFICWLFPNGQELRPEIFPRQNVFTWLVGRIYAADTNTNVLPSMHVVGCAAACSALLYSPAVKNRGVRWGAVLLGLLISVSTVFVKQHSLLDIIAALALCAPLYLAVYAPVIVKRGRRRLVRLREYI